MRRHLLFEPKFKPARVAQLVKRVGWTTCPQQVECSIPQGAIYLTLNFNPQGWLNWLKGWVEQHVLNRSSVRSPKAPFIKIWTKIFYPQGWLNWLKGWVEQHVLNRSSVRSPKAPFIKIWTKILNPQGWLNWLKGWVEQHVLNRSSVRSPKAPFIKIWTKILKPARVAQLVKRVGWTTCPQQVECSIPQGAIY